MDKNKPVSVGDILKKLITTTPLGKVMEQARVWEHWPEIAGESLAPHGRPAGVKERQLRVEVEDSVWMSRFSYQKWDIIRRINRLAGHELVSDIFFTLMDENAGDAPGPGTRRRRKKGGGTGE